MSRAAVRRAACICLMAMAEIMQMGTVLAQDGEASSSPAGLASFVLFLGIAGIGGVFVIRWSQSTPDDED